jgi:hypothetical protein
MHNYTDLLYDVNANAPPNDINYFAGLPHDPLQISVPSHVPIPAAASNLQNISAFFKPRSILQPNDIPVIKSNDIFGDAMNTPISPNRTRLYFINLNGINLTKGAVKFRDLCSEIKQADIDILAASEHNLDTNKFVVRQLLQQMATQSFDHHTIQTATSSIPADKFYKPGGTMLLAQGNVVGRIKERGSDPLGRWSWIKLIGRNKRLITVISAYQVCIRPTHATGTTAYHQQESLLRQKGITKPKPRKYFHRDLNDFVKTSKNRQELIILVGDFNEPMNERSSMARIASTHQLVDVLYQRNSHLPEPNTYARGSTRIDYALISPELTEAVTECGYEPFHKRIKSDHRGFFIDFNTELLFGNTTPTLAPMALREFTSKNPANNSVYIQAKYAHLQEQQFFRHLAELQALPQGDNAKAERLDSMLCQASEHAGKQLTRYRRPWWSLKLTKQRVVTEILQSLLSGFRNHIDVREVLLARILEHSLDLILPVTKSECEELLRTNRASLANMEKNSLEIRHAEMEATSNVESASGNKSNKKTRDALQATEAHAAMYRKVKAIRGKFNKSGFTSIEVPTSWPPAHTEPSNLQELPDPKTANEWKTVDLPDEIVYYLLTRNRLHFGQADGTPLTTPRFTRDIDWQASTDSAELILQGDYTSEELTDLQELLLKHCKSPKIDALSPLITEEEFISKFKSWNERTSTSPSGLHLGHYKALVSRNDADLTTDEGMAIENQRRELIRAHTAMLNYSLRHSYSFDRWKNVVNVMIEKEQGNSKIHRLRVIHIYEADYNFLLQAKWRALIQHAEAENTLHPGQYGGRSGRDAKILVFIEELKTEICYASRKSLINFDNDAASCYDRIIPSLASLIGRKFGMHRNVIFVHATTLEETKYKLKTSMGISDEFYANCQAFPIYGTGQGSGNSPAIWCIVSSVLFACHQDQGHGAYFCTPDKQMSVSLSMIGFVDDSTGQVNEFELDTQPTPEFLRKIMQTDAQLWSDLLWLSGGLLELGKCSFHQIHFDFEADGRPLMRAGTYGDPLLVQDALTSSSVIIPAKSAFQTHKTLGHHKAPAGKNITQLRILQANSDVFSKLVATSPCNRTDSWFFYTAIYLKSIGYVLPNCFYEERDLLKVQKSALRAFLAKCGFNRNTQRTIVFAPIRFGGCGFFPLFLIQGEGQILQFLTHWRTDTTAGNLLRISISWVQLHLGISWFFLADTTTPLPHIPGRWLKSLRDFLSRIDGTLEVDDYFLPPTQRANDVYLMDLVLASDQFTQKEICTINYCRMHLQAVTMADLCLADGVSLDPALLSGNPAPTSSTSKWIHINQARPSEPCWRLWRRACAMWSHQLQLNFPLGPWTRPGDKLRRSWPYYYDSDNGEFYVRQESGYLRCVSIDPIRFSPISQIDWQPTPTSIPVHARLTIQGDDWIPLIPPTSVAPTASATTAATFPEFLSSLDTWETELFADLTMHVDCYEFIHLVETQLARTTGVQLLTVSDGSDDAGAMTFGWIVSLPDGTRLARCSGPAYGPFGTSFRAEGYGFLSVSRFLLRLHEFCGITPTWCIKLMTDNLGLLTRIEKCLPYPDPFPNTTLQPDWDVTNEIIVTLQELKIQPILEHVKGHQDDHTPYDDLPLEAQLNVDADHEAGYYQTMFPAKRPIIPRLPHNRVQLHLSNKVISSKLKQSIRDAFTVPPYMEYLKKRNHWSSECLATIDWTAYNQAVSRFSSQRVQITKLCNDLLPTSRWANRYDSLTSEHCLHCGEPEDRDHLVRCTFEPRLKWRKELLTQLRKTHDDPLVNPYLVDILHDGLHSWLTYTQIDTAQYPRRYHQLIEEQTAIGWRQLFNGHLSTQWRIRQDNFLRRGKLQTRVHTGANWALRTLTTIWTAFFKIWKDRNEAIHGHDLKTQNQARQRRLRAEMELLHSKRDQVLAVDNDVFIGDTPAALDTFLTVSSPTHVQNWLHVWKPIIVSSVQSAKDMAIKGVRLMSDYFPTDPTTNTGPRHPNTRAHRTTRPRHRATRPALPQPSFQFRSLRSFFGLQHRNPPLS